MWQLNVELSRSASSFSRMVHGLTITSREHRINQETLFAHWWIARPHRRFAVDVKHAKPLAHLVSDPLRTSE